MLEQTPMTDKYRGWIEAVSAQFGGLDLCALEVLVARDGREIIMELNDCALPLLGDSQEEDRRLISELVLHRMNVSHVLPISRGAGRFPYGANRILLLLIFFFTLFVFSLLRFCFPVVLTNFSSVPFVSINESIHYRMEEPGRGVPHRKRNLIVVLSPNTCLRERSNSCEKNRKIRKTWKTFKWTLVRPMSRPTSNFFFFFFRNSAPGVLGETAFPVPRNLDISRPLWRDPCAFLFYIISPISVWRNGKKC